MRTYGLSGEFRADSAAKKLVAMEEPHLRHVARIVTQHHALADIRGEGGVDVAHALETHAIHMDFAGFGDRQKQQAAEIGAARTANFATVEPNRRRRRRSDHH